MVRAAARGKCLKTSIELDMAVSFASGTDFLGISSRCAQPCQDYAPVRREWRNHDRAVLPADLCATHESRPDHT